MDYSLRYNHFNNYWNVNTYKAMREIKYIVLHCTATPQNTKIVSILNYWKEIMKWKTVGYHYIINRFGNVTQLLSVEKISNGVAGHNKNSIHISYIGGVDENGKAIDNRTPEQKTAQIELLERLKFKYPKAIICGHRDFEGVKKDCPSFDVKSWLKEINFLK